MSVIAFPNAYVNNLEIKNTGSLLKSLGHHAFVLGGKRAFVSVRDDLLYALQSESIDYDIELVDCFPTLERAQKYAERIRRDHYDFVISIGGGRITDLAKTVSELAKVPIATIPTVPTTCTPWTTLCVLYNDDGVLVQNFFRKKAPDLVIVDKELLFNAPKKYWIAGISDSMTKWYEISASYHGENKNNIQLAVKTKVSELIVRFIEEEFLDEYIEDDRKVSLEKKSNVLDAIFALTGVPDSIKGDIPFGGIAHPFYNNSTKIPETHQRLHGEIVLYGLFVQLFIEGRDKEEIVKKMRKTHKLGVPIRISELGIVENSREKIKALSEDIVKSVPYFVPIKSALTPSQVENAIYSIDSYGKEIEENETA